MATSISKQKHHHLLLLLAAVALISLAVPASGDEEVDLRLYMHDVVGGPGQKAVLIVKGTEPMNPSLPPGNYFGGTVAFDDVLTERPSPSSKAVGRAQGTYMLASMRRPVYVVHMVLLLTDGRYDGSTLVVEGRDDTSQEARELAVTGGTGELRGASGYVVCRTARKESKLHAVMELDVHAYLPDEDGSPSQVGAPPIGS